MYKNNINNFGATKPSSNIQIMNIKEKKGKY